MYYLRSRAAADAIKFTVDTSLLEVVAFVHYQILLPFCSFAHFTYICCLSIIQEKTGVAEDDDTKMAQMVCSLTNREECLSCGS